MLSVAGYTLGGIFCVEYEDSPIGPYREVAVLSSLVGLAPSPLRFPAIGAWASHIFVDSSQVAVDYGREIWGLPATRMAIQFVPDGDDPAVRFDTNEIIVSGWENVTIQKPRSRDWWNVSLPSFSGMLSQGDE